MMPSMRICWTKKLKGNISRSCGLGFFHFPFFLLHCCEPTFFPWKMNMDRMKVLETTKCPPLSHFFHDFSDFHPHFIIFSVIFHFQSWFFFFSSPSIRASLSPELYHCIHFYVFILQVDSEILSAGRSAGLRNDPCFHYSLH